MRRLHLLLLIPLLLPLSVRSQDAGGKIETILTRIERNSGATLDQDIVALKELGRSAVEEVRGALKRPDPYIRLAAGAYLYANEFRDEALQAIQSVLSETQNPPKRRAAEMLAALVAGDSRLDASQRKKAADDIAARARLVGDDIACIHLWRTVWYLTESIAPKRELRALMDRSTEADVKGEAALALAEMDSYIGAGESLHALSSESGDRGRLARAYLKLKSVQDELNRQLVRSVQPGTAKRDYSVLDEILDKLHEGYFDESKIDDAKLIEAASRGMCAVLDRYSSYYDAEMIRELNEEDLGGRYGGIGARVANFRDSNGNTWLTIVEPIFSGPAYRAGLRSNDQLVEVEGVVSANKEVEEMIKKLRGLPGSKVKFKVFRRGWEEPREFEIIREEIQLETTMYRMLPGEIGYISLATFGPQDVDGVRDAIESLTNDGMKALVFDLRGNSGGLLSTAERLADLFLQPDLLIVSTRARGEERNRRLSRRQPLTDVPLVMLVNDRSASASEILAGCLQSHKRALLVGTRTFGKGSVQELRKLESTQGATAVRMTVAKWYLPDGRSVEAENEETPGGVAPDIEVKIAERDYWKETETERMRATGELDTYLAKQFPEHRELFTRIAESDGGDATRYPDFDALLDAVKSKAPREDATEILRELLREFVRKAVQDDQGRPLYFDFQKDLVLQRGILEACKKSGVSAQDIPEYGTFAKAND